MIYISLHLRAAFAICFFVLIYGPSTVAALVQCNAIARDNTEGKKKCGIAGNAKAHIRPASSMTVNEQQDCAQACANKANCNSFSFTPDSSTCDLYRKPLDKTFTADNTSTTMYWGAPCYMCTPAGQLVRLQVSPRSRSNAAGLFVRPVFNGPSDARSRLTLEQSAKANFVIDEPTGHLLTANAPHLNIAYKGLNFTTPSVVSVTTKAYFIPSRLTQILKCTAIANLKGERHLNCIGLGDTTFFSLNCFTLPGQPQVPSVLAIGPKSRAGRDINGCLYEPVTILVKDAEK